MGLQGPCGQDRRFHPGCSEYRAGDCTGKRNSSEYRAGDRSGKRNPGRFGNQGHRVVCCGGLGRLELGLRSAFCATPVSGDRYRLGHRPGPLGGSMYSQAVVSGILPASFPGQSGKAGEPRERRSGRMVPAEKAELGVAPRYQDCRGAVDGFEIWGQSEPRGVGGTRHEQGGAGPPTRVRGSASPVADPCPRPGAQDGDGSDCALSSPVGSWKGSTPGCTR